MKTLLTFLIIIGWYTLIGLVVMLLLNECDPHVTIEFHPIGEEPLTETYTCWNHPAVIIFGGMLSIILGLFSAREFKFID